MPGLGLSRPRVERGYRRYIGDIYRVKGYAECIYISIYIYRCDCI